jgi:peroxiredoxin
MQKPRLSHFIVVEVKDKVPTRLFVDTDADGEFSKDEVFAWQQQILDKGNGEKVTNTFYNVRMKLSKEGKMGVVYMRYLKRGESPMSMDQPLIACQCDYGSLGETIIGERTVKVAVCDVDGSVDFSAKSSRGKVPMVWIDGNGNEAHDRGELFSANRTFKMTRTVWGITNMTADGSFEVALLKTNQNTTVTTEKPKKSSELSAGTKAPSFTAKLMDGKTLKFPEDYKGKILLLDFWATWCGPCLEEVPNVVANYKKYHDKGLEILGISLDRENAEKKIARITDQKKMTWPQIYDGEYWESAVAKLYGVHAIPYMLLVNGDTGEILASGKDIRGNALGDAIEQALAAKK